MSGAVRLLTDADYFRMPWRNGRGGTVEIWRETDGAGALLWRVSIADVVEAGAFSVFEGIDRILMLIEGAGFDLDFGGGMPAARPVAQFTPVRFSGDWRSGAEQVRGPSRDLNVMTARDRFHADLVVHRQSFEGRITDQSLFLALDGSWSLSLRGEAWEARAGDTLMIASPEDGERIAAAGAGVLVQINIQVTMVAAL